MENTIKVVAISDTHGYKPNLPDGHILIHAGDFTMHGSEYEALEFFEYFTSHPHPVKVLVHGNHDQCMLDGYPVPEGVHALVNSSMDAYGLVIYGSPYTPPYSKAHDAFVMGEYMREVMYKHMPKKVDILVTHSPPRGVLDRVPGQHVGCKALQQYYRRASHHVVGHIHETGGCVQVVGETTCYNASHVNHRMEPAHEAHVFFVPRPPDRGIVLSSGAQSDHESRLQ